MFLKIGEFKKCTQNTLILKKSMDLVNTGKGFKKYHAMVAQCGVFPFFSKMVKISLKNLNNVLN